MSVQVKEEVVSDEDEEDCRKSRENPVEILQYEQNILVDTMDDHIVFIGAKGLGMENLFLNHLIMYSDPKLLFLVLNTTQNDEAFFLAKLKEAKVSCEPKFLNAEVSTKDREEIYLSGGVQFITSRILMVDLLTKRIPVGNVSGILVYRAHQIMQSYQESFILRLYREHKPGGIVKAFTDLPTSVASIGQLQRMVDRLYVKRVRLIPRFDVDVKTTMDKNPPRMIEVMVNLSSTYRKIHATLVDLLKVTMKELKLCSSLTKESQDDSMNQVAFGISSLERMLTEKRSLLTSKQKRLLSDLSLLREFLQMAEDLDPATLFTRLNTLRNDKEAFEQTGGWLATSTASRLFTDAEELCGGKTVDGFVAPPKWEVLADILDEIKSIPVRTNELNPDGPSVLIFVNSDCVSRQVCDLIINGPLMLSWIVRRQLGTFGMKEPEKNPLWDPDSVTPFFQHSLEQEPRKTIISNLQKNQKTAARAAKKRRQVAEDLAAIDSKKQTNIIQFGVLQYKRLRKNDKESETSAVQVKEELVEEDAVNDNVEISSCKNTPLIVMSTGERYNQIRQLEKMKPTFIILYNTDIVTLRLIEMYKARNSELHLQVYSIMHRESTEEARYLHAINNETKAFESLVKEQASLLIAREFDTDREEAPCLRLSTRDGGGNLSDPNERSKIIVDMREFNSELPTILYKKGYDILAATIEIGDYVLSPNIAVERKALDDLTQSLQSGRVFKQIEQMILYYANTILLIESNQKFDVKIVNGGPFQGELTRHCRDIRAQLCALLRSNPKLKLIWSHSPTISADYFSELKLSSPEPDLDKAVSLKSGELANENDDKDQQRCKGKLNAVLLRQLSRCIPGMAAGDVKIMMTNGKLNSIKDLFVSTVEQQNAAIGHYCDRIFILANRDFSQQNI